MQKLLIFLSTLIFISPLTTHADETELKNQIEQLRQQMQKLQTQTNSLLEHQNLEVETKTHHDTNIGGYGEIGYNHYRSDSSRTQMDLKRFVLSIEHRFNDDLSFNGEVEWEHAVTSNTDKGESEIEQAFLNYQLSPKMNMRAGLFLMPFGLLNESHEPPVFYGVERNEVETRIIPSTWREGGVSLSGTNDIGLDWNIGLVTGFDIAKFDDPSSPLHAIHQELQFAKARDLAYYLALNYRAPGFTFGTAAFTGDSGQDNADYKADNTLPSFSGIGGRVTLADVHSRFQKAGWDLEGVYAKGGISNASDIDQNLQSFNTANSAKRSFVPAEFYGWLLQAAYQFSLKENMTLAPFIRYEEFDTQAKMPAGFISDSANADHVTTLGLSFKPHPQVVAKADYQTYKTNSANDRFNLGIGYMF